jgi:hypothetical protein
MDYKKLVDDKKKELKDLHDRMDEDANLVNLKGYVLQDVNKRPIPNSISVTLNDLAVFAANVEASLGSAVEQIVVESEDEKLDKDTIRDAIRAGFLSADNRLSKRGGFKITPFTDQAMCRRGRGAALCLFRIENEQLITDIIPWDTRYTYYDIGTEGLSWAAYETERTQKQVEVEYELTTKGEKATVLNIWTPESNLIYIDAKLEFEQPNPYGYVPVCIQVVPMGSMLIELDGQHREGESIFFLVRDLFPELNRLISIIQTLNQKELDHALLLRKPGGSTMRKQDAPTHSDLTDPGNVIAGEPDMAIDPIALGNLKEQAWLLNSVVEARLQRAMISAFDYGTFTQTMSAVALIEIGEGRDQVFLPRLGARGLLKQQLARMFIDQIINSGESSVEIGTRGHKRAFDVSKLEGEYDITFKYFNKSPRLDAARYTLAAGSDLPRRIKWRDILQLEDPEEAEDEHYWEIAEKISPIVLANRTIKRLYRMADRGDDDAKFEAELLEKQFTAQLEQSKQAPPTKEEEKPPVAPLSLFPKTAAKPKKGISKPRIAEEEE